MLAAAGAQRSSQIKAQTRMKAKQQQVDRNKDRDRDGEDGGTRHTGQTTQHANASVRLLQGH